MTREAIGVGNTIVLAQKKACEILGVSDGEVSFEVVQLPRRKFLGIFGGRLAKVRALLYVDPAELAANYLKTVLIAFGAKDFDILVNKRDDGSELLVKGGNANRAIGRRGDTLDAIQYLTCLVANSVCESYYRITINIEDYRQRRKDTLEILGRKLAFKALKSREKVVLEPMTPYERKLIHAAVSQVLGVESYSEGEDLDRHVIIAPILKKRAVNLNNKDNCFEENKISLYERCN